MFVFKAYTLFNEGMSQDVYFSEKKNQVKSYVQDLKSHSIYLPRKGRILQSVFWRAACN